jgi:hypothetical protein
MLIVAHYDLAGTYDRIAKLVMELSAVDINFFVQTALASTGQADGPPPVNLRQDLLARARERAVLPSRA